MSDSVYLQMPPAGSAQRPGRKMSVARTTRLFAVVLLLLGCALGAALYWQAQGAVTSLAAVVDGTVYPVTPQFSAVLESLSVQAGDKVTAGQEVGRMHAGAYGRALSEAGREAAALRPPDMEESAARLKQAQEAEKDIITRLAQARHEEDARRSMLEERVTEHVRAQIQLRGLDSQGGERAVGKSRYAASRDAESQARSRMDAARAEFEQISRMRAVMDQELGRIRDEMLRAKQLASQSRYSRSAAAGVNRAPLAAAAVDGRLYASVDGTVLRTDAAPGQMLAKGSNVLWIQPDGPAGAPWVLAYLPAEAAQNVKTGQAARVRLESGGASLRGTVEQVYAPQAPPVTTRQAGQAGRAGQAIRGAVQVVPVRIALKLYDAALTDAALAAPGTPAVCVVETRSVLGFSGF